MSLMTPEWLNAYNAGIFTEFQEQRAPGHTVLGYRMFKTGFLSVKKEIKQAIEALDFFSDNSAFEKLEELNAMDIACDEIIMYANRHADILDELEVNEKNTARKNELSKMATICRKVPALSLIHISEPTRLLSIS